MSAARPIDVVYTWVDGNDPTVRAARARHLRDAGSAGADGVGAHRFRDNDELRYSLRALETFAPWTGHVHLVTNGQVPAWLDRSHPDLSVVTHEAIFPDPNHLPTFNSRAIELHLCRIPALSERFLYFNDDVFLGRPVSTEDFLTPAGGQKAFFDGFPVPSDPHQGGEFVRAAAYTRGLLDVRFGKREGRRMLAHTPRLYDRELVRRIVAEWPREAERTSAHRFRAPDDLALNLLYDHYLFESAALPPVHAAAHLANPSEAYCFVSLTDNDLAFAAHFKRIAELRPRFFCVNDDLAGHDFSPTIRRQLRAFLEWYFPRPSRFEASSPSFSAPVTPL
jgi:hypothetical protein